VWDRPPDHIALSPADRCRLAWADDSSLTSAEVALRAGCTPAQAADVRRRLANLGVLPPLREPRRAFPQHVPLPRAPRILAEGACVGVLPSPWTSDDPAQRAHARIVCITECHVADACLAWALRAVPAGDPAIYAGTGPSERRALRAERGIRRPNAVAAINAAKVTCPRCGLPLQGPNLVTEPGRRPGTVRRRCRACTARRKREYERSRAARRAREAS
jgi:Transcription factor WhiB